MAHISNEKKPYETPQDALAHYGVKGMRWGVRKEEDAAGGRPPAKKETGDEALARMDQAAEANSDRILEQAGVARNPNYERNRKLMIAGGVGVGIAALAAGAYVYSNQRQAGASSQDTAGVFDAKFSLGLKNQLTKKIAPLDELDDNDLTLPSSTVLRRVVGSADEPLSDSHMYVSHLDEDRDRYVGVFSNVVKGRAGSAHLAEMSLNTSISSPSLKKRVELMKSMLNDVDRDPKSLTEGMTFREVLVESTAAARAKVLGGSETDYESRLSKLSDDDLVRETYGTFINSMGGQLNNPQYRVSHPTMYLDKVRSMGYNALVDDANVGVLAKSPLLLLTPQTTVKSRSIKNITDQDVKAARDNIKLLLEDTAVVRHTRLPPPEILPVLVKPYSPQEIYQAIRQSTETRR